MKIQNVQVVFKTPQTYSRFSVLSSGVLARLRYYSAELVKFIKKESAVLNVLSCVRVGALSGTLSKFNRLFVTNTLSCKRFFYRR